ncbi:MAG: hypothetical protein BME94_08560 [Methanobacteriales archaeon Met13]
MKALIIAAGKGSRLKGLTKDEPKPLIQLLGLSLIERVILTAKQAGIDEFVVVICYLGEKIKEKLDDGNRYGVKITYIENREWQKGNGVSVLKAKELLNENFVLLMADHIFDSRILKELVDYDLRSSVVLAVDRRKPLPEDTKVIESNGKIVDIGKDIEESNCIDTGIFLCSPKIFSYIEETVKEDKTELTHGIAKASKNKDAQVFDITQIENHASKMRKEIKLLWIDIDTEEDYREAERILCRGLIKPTDGPVSKFLNRPISIRISKLLIKTRINPNSISFFCFILCILSSFFFSMGTYLYLVVGGLLAQISSIIDGCDGEIARLKFQESSYGAWFDSSLDRYADALIILGMVFGWWSLHGNVEIWVIGFIALIGCFMNSYTAIRYDSIFIRNTKIRFGRDIRLFLIIVGALLNQIFYTLIILAILTNAESIRRLYILRNE